LAYFYVGPMHSCSASAVPAIDRSLSVAIATRTLCRAVRPLAAGEPPCHFTQCRANRVTSAPSGAGANMRWRGWASSANAWAGCPSFGGQRTALPRMQARPSVASALAEACQAAEVVALSRAMVLQQEPLVPATQIRPTWRSSGPPTAAA
jgi:hypothetical protein